MKHLSKWHGLKQGNQNAPPAAVDFVVMYITTIVLGHV
jgi:hypothetical protein